MTPEELASTMEGHAVSCDQHAAFHRNRERHGTPDRRREYHDYAVRNEQCAETLRQWAGRIRVEFATITELLAQTDHYVVVFERGWVVEHSIECRLRGHMADCPFSLWCVEHINDSRQWPTGRFRMNDKDPHYMALEPA